MLKKLLIGALAAGAIGVAVPAVAFAEPSTAPDGANGAPGGASSSVSGPVSSSSPRQKPGGFFQLEQWGQQFLDRLRSTPGLTAPDGANG